MTISAQKSSSPVMDELAFCTLAAIARHLDDGGTTARSLCEMMLERIRHFNPSIGAYSDLVAERALEDAEASDTRRRAGKALGPLDGVPIAIKDLVDTTPAYCKAGLDHLSQYRPDQDAFVVRQLRSAGAIILGVTETDAGAFGTSTPAVVNPLAPDRIAGGSSGGSAAVVAAGLAFAAIGTDTGGSIRIPSFCCSTYGFKPTWGRVSVDGIRALAPSLDHAGPMARCVADLRLLQAMLDPDVGGNNSAARQNLRIGFSPAYFEDADPLVKSAMAAVMDKLADAGLEMKEVPFPTPDEAMDVHMVNALKEIADYQTSHFGELWKGYPEVARVTVEVGNKIDAADFAAAERARHGLRSDVERVFSSVDVMVLPTLAMDAPLRSERDIQLNAKSYSVLAATVRYTALFNQTGHPVVAMPGHSMADGRALGIQLVGRMNADAELLWAAQTLERILEVSVDYRSILAREEKNILHARASIQQGGAQ